MTAPTPAPVRARTAALAALVPLALGVGAGYRAYGLRVGSLVDPGPGLWPLAVCVFMVLVSAALLATAGRALETEAFTRSSAVVLGAAASLVVYAALWNLIGFEIPTALLLVLWLRVIGGESWRTTLVTAVLGTAAFYLLFIVALGVSLPHLISF